MMQKSSWNLKTFMPKEVCLTGEDIFYMDNQDLENQA